MYAHVPDQLRKKLDDKGERCIFIGYIPNSKTYKFYNPKIKKKRCQLPTRLQDYIMGNDNDPSDEEINNFALFTNLRQ
ncbi:hypothetical protein CR513_50788, partial [Mucuna pruriens]